MTLMASKKNDKLPMYDPGSRESSFSAWYENVNAAMREVREGVVANYPHTSPGHWDMPLAHLEEMLSRAHRNLIDCQIAVGYDAAIRRREAEVARRRRERVSRDRFAQLLHDALANGANYQELAVYHAPICGASDTQQAPDVQRFQIDLRGLRQTVRLLERQGMGVPWANITANLWQEAVDAGAWERYYSG